MSAYTPPSFPTTSFPPTTTTGYHVYTLPPSPTSSGLWWHHHRPHRVHKGLSGGAIAGIVVGVLAFVALLGALAFFLIRRRRRARLTSAKYLDMEKPSTATKAPYNLGTVPATDRLSPEAHSAPGSERGGVV
ncbi:uncharacterized protein EHS24_006574 [Apiotrichum porosum]|uniref:Uncharacterized protein n=1 Tax=Apiotrichum porosum TaxID=105984 RepID=A0A427Y1N4_9TREE|nr:uncharacterized protein EHS24_006574 [Apiotrichum porosum]RSH84997.1 hypothetical protein EHS24_006574 [Apiotrichum porosum]